MEVPAMCEMFKLNEDCLRELYKYLMLSDWISMSQTCKYLNCFTGNLFVATHPKTVAYSGHGGIRINGVDVKSLIPFISNVSLVQGEPVDFEILNADFRTLNQISLCLCDVSLGIFEIMKPTLKKIESLDLVRCSFGNGANIFTDFLQTCASLRTLKINSWQDENIIQNFGNDWLRVKYPKLECFILDLSFPDEPIDELSTFFSKNDQLKFLSIDANTFWVNLESIMTANLQLTELRIEFVVDEYFDSLVTLFQVLNKMHGKHLYQRLYVKFEEPPTDPHFLHILSKLQAFQKLAITVDWDKIRTWLNLSEFINLTEWDLCDSDE